MENNRSIPKPHIIDKGSQDQHPIPDTCAQFDKYKLSSGPSVANVVGCVSTIGTDVSPLPQGFDDDTTLETKQKESNMLVARPEVIAVDIDEPVPTTLPHSGTKDGFMSKFSMKSSGRLNKKQTVAPDNTKPGVEKIRDSYSSCHYSSAHSVSISMKSSGHSSGKKLSLSEKGLAVACPATEENNPVYIASEYDPSDKTSFYKSTKCHVFTALALLVTAAVIVAVVIYAVRNRPPDIVPLKTPSTVSITERESRIRQMIEDHVLQRNATFSDMSTADPRYLALEWIVNDDRLQLTTTDSNLLQRYVLAILAFSFDLLSWQCGLVKMDSCNVTDDYGDYALWLSRTDECDWYGVDCNANGVATGLDLCE